MTRVLGFCGFCFMAMWLSGCGKQDKSPSNASKDELELRMSRDLKLTDFHLEKTGSNKYIGKGKADDGTIYEFQVEIENNKLKYEGKNDKGHTKTGTMSWHESSGP